METASSIGGLKDAISVVQIFRLRRASEGFDLVAVLCVSRPLLKVNIRLEKNFLLFYYVEVLGKIVDFEESFTFSVFYSPSLALAWRIAQKRIFSIEHYF